ncbi:CRE-NHR-31 protein [Aphelenchoides avenae]|nr:CRE-NHR-31 protein [Aphelenchus avenae]
MDYDYWDEKTSSSGSGSVGRSALLGDYDDLEELESSTSLLQQMISNADPLQGHSLQHQIIENHQQQQYKMFKMSRTSTPMASTASYHIRDKPKSNFVSTSGDATCAVCGDGHAKLHYGVLACYGCKGFFRRTLTGKYRYVCRFGNNCVVDKYQRNSCRYCRFNRCLEVGMDPKAVRPDRDLTGKQKVPRARKRQMDEELINHMARDDWSRKIPVEAKVLLMQLLNIESKVAKGDVNTLPPSEKPNPKNVSLRELFEQKPPLSGRRTEMCYEPYRMAKAEELGGIAHRSALAGVDWVESLAEIGELVDTEDKIALAKACYAPLTIFNISARTVQNTKNPDILCLCSYSYVPRKLPAEYNASNHLSNNLIDRTLNELVAPLRKLNLREEEVVPLKAIIILNPNAKGLSPEGQQHVIELRDKIQDMLFQVVKELHPVYNASSRFGNLLLLLPTITTLSGVMCENMQFNQVLGNRTNMEPLLNELFDNNQGEEDALVHSATVSPPIYYDNPADINLESFMPITYVKSQTNSVAEKADSGTQTEPSDDCCSPLTSLSSGSMINGYSPQEPLSQNISPFPNLLEDELEPHQFTTSAANLFESAGCSDLFGLMH